MLRHNCMWPPQPSGFVDCRFNNPISKVSYFTPSTFCLHACTLSCCNVAFPLADDSEPAASHKHLTKLTHSVTCHSIDFMETEGNHLHRCYRIAATEVEDCWLTNVTSLTSSISLAVALTSLRLTHLHSHHCQIWSVCIHTLSMCQWWCLEHMNTAWPHIFSHCWLEFTVPTLSRPQSTNVTNYIFHSYEVAQNHQSYTQGPFEKSSMH